MLDDIIRNWTQWSYLKICGKKTPKKGLIALLVVKENDDLHQLTKFAFQIAFGFLLF
jgi:hypothetical protein